MKKIKNKKYLISDENDFNRLKRFIEAKHCRIHSDIGFNNEAPLSYPAVAVVEKHGFSLDSHFSDSVMYSLTYVYPGDFEEENN